MTRQICADAKKRSQALAIVTGMQIPLLAIPVIFSLGMMLSDRNDHVGPRLRPVDPLARHLFQIGNTRSASFQALVSRLQHSDLIVYIRTTHMLPSGIDGRLQFAAAQSGVRYVHVTVRTGVAGHHAVGILGHELMHAVEVANDASVRDMWGFRNLYARIGHSSDGVAFDTRTAQAAGAQVVKELVAAEP